MKCWKSADFSRKYNQFLKVALVSVFAARILVKSDLFSHLIIVGSGIRYKMHTHNVKILSARRVILGHHKTQQLSHIHVLEFKINHLVVYPSMHRTVWQWKAWCFKWTRCDEKALCGQDFSKTTFFQIS